MNEEPTLLEALIELRKSMEEQLDTLKQLNGMFRGTDEEQPNA